MNPKTLEALKLSIEHWERLATGAIEPGEDLGCKYCALCQRFEGAHCENNSGKICPVKKQSNHIMCRETPYQHVVDMRQDFGVSSKQFQDAAQIELEFLQSLLPKGEQM